MPITDLETTWNRIRSDLRDAVSDSTFQVWLEPLRPALMEDHVLVVEAPDSIRHWVEGRFTDLIAQAAQRVTGISTTVELTEPGKVTDIREVSASSTTRGFESDSFAGPSQTLDLDPKLTFDQFVIGESNRLAHAAALAVAEQPSQAYNPLFIYGPPGVGKTHLLQAIGNLVREAQPDARIEYTTAEDFTNGFVHSIRQGDTREFKSKFRDVDLLLLDDAQFLASKTKTEEEFFHTFNSLISSGAQVVITCDRTPADLDSLEARLRERFAAGLVANVESPEIPTRLAILTMRAQRDQLGDIPRETLEAIASRIKGNVRSLEGALIRVVAYASLTGVKVTRELTTQVLDQLYPGATNAPVRKGVGEIKTLVASTYGVTEADLDSRSRAAEFVWPRQIAMYLSREVLGEPLPSIGRQFGGRNHSTVLNACRRVADRISASPEDALAIRSLERLVSGEADRED
ncbi:MAG: chromosomal replication initiator protein DnaA [Solirubrobacterales bacterium]|nr:chromosomal replication initiator protein DnaA [Solirubrobacterales bacterium]